MKALVAMVEGSAGERAPELPEVAIGTEAVALGEGVVLGSDIADPELDRRDQVGSGQAVTDQGVDRTGSTVLRHDDRPSELAGGRSMDRHGLGGE